ncbi:MAG: hypothetical protein U1E05_00845, partial [Patescibacteria group bacterium]|nr:hypothetical protein [Patescibacteria group bacterium]
MHGTGLDAYSLVVLGRGTAAVAAAREAASRGGRVALLSPDNPPARKPDAVPPSMVAPSLIAPSTDEAGADRRAIRRLQARRGLLPPPLPLDEPRIKVLSGPLRFHRYRTVLVG